MELDWEGSCGEVEDKADDEKGAAVILNPTLLYGVIIIFAMIPRNLLRKGCLALEL